MKKYLIALVIFVLLAALPPMFFSQYWLHVMIISLFYVMMASSCPIVISGATRP